MIERKELVFNGGVSVLVSGLVAATMREPTCTKARDRSSLLSCLKMPSFWVIVVQGAFHSDFWKVFLYMDIISLYRNGGEALSVLSAIAVGGILGGLVADGLATRLHLRGRLLSAQLVVAVGVLLMLLVLGTTVERGTFTVIAFGLLGSWAQSGTTLPILSQIAPPGARSRTMAW